MNTSLGLIVGIFWTLGQFALIAISAYIVVRLAVTHALRAFYHQERSTADQLDSPAE